MLSVAPKNGPEGRLQLHATTVVINDHAVAFVGPSGAGKSGMALRFMAQGAQLLADDITWLEGGQCGVIAHCPPALLGKIEARGVGLLHATPYLRAPLTLLVDLGVAEPARIPDRKSVALLGHDIPLFHNPETPHFVDAILHYVLNGWADGPKGIQ